MAETANTAKAAELASSKIFRIFGWDTKGPMNQNWECCKPKEHKPTKKRRGKSGSKTKMKSEDEEVKYSHPSDVVFWYDDPHTANRVYLNTDLKSYAKNTIKKNKVESALESLGKAVDCARVSDDWQSLYTHEGKTRDIRGMLFVYNHDGEFPDEFGKLLDSISNNKANPPTGSILHVLGPTRIGYLHSVARDIQVERGKGEDEGFPPAERCFYYYPHQLQQKARNPLWKCASIEVLSGPWQILSFSKLYGGAVFQTYIVYTADTGASRDEFKYMIDFLFRKQIACPTAKVNIRMPFAEKKAAAHFDGALEDYFESYFEHLSSMREVMTMRNNITFESIVSEKEIYSDIELGMDNA